MNRSTVGVRVRTAARRRLYRRRAAVVWMSICVVVLAGFRPTGADASWVAMQAKAVAQVREGVDLWEKHTRQLEDWMDKASGMIQPFSDLHAGYRELTDLRGVKRLGKMGQVYRANLSNPDCFKPGNIGNCSAVRDFVPSSIRRIDDDAFRILGRASSVADGYSWNEIEAAIRYTGGSRDGGSGQWLDDTGLGSLSTGPNYRRFTAGLPAADTVGRLQDIDDTLARVQHYKVRAFRNVRRATGLADRYQRLGADVLRVTRAEGDGSGLLSLAASDGGSGDFDRDADGGVVCNAGTGSSLVTSATARSNGSTILAQVMELDCAGGADAGGNPLDPLTPGAHVSPNEVLGVQAALSIWEANQAATQLEDMALQVSNLVQSRQAEAAASRRAEEREKERLECPQAPSLINCDSFEVVSPDEFSARQRALYDSISVN